MVGKARDILTKAVGRNAYLAMASGMGVTVLTQSSTITTSVLVPFAGAGINGRAFPRRRLRAPGARHPSLEARVARAGSVR
jgi:Na+/Pi-cotransporter